jgi:hypothetical protein
MNNIILINRRVWKTTGWRITLKVGTKQKEHQGLKTSLTRQPLGAQNIKAVGMGVVLETRPRTHFGRVLNEGAQCKNLRIRKDYPLRKMLGEANGMEK